MATSAEEERIQQLQKDAFSLFDTYQSTGSQESLDLAIDLLKEASHLVSENHQLSRDLGKGYLKRYMLHHKLPDLNDAIIQSEIALQLVPPEHPDWPEYAASVAEVHKEQYKATKDQTAIDTSIDIYMQMLERAQKYPTNEVSIHAQLAMRYNDRYERTGDSKDISKAISHFSHAFQKTTDQDSKRMLSMGMVTMVLKQYELTRGFESVDDAIKNCKECLAFTPPDLPVHIRIRQSLAQCLRAQYVHTRVSQSLEEAISNDEAALKCMVADNKELTDQLVTTGMNYSYRFGRTGDMDDLAKSIMRYQSAMSEIVEYKPELAIRFDSLGRDYHRRFLESDNVTDIEMSIALCTAACTVPVSSTVERAELFESLSQGFESRYFRCGDMKDLGIAIKRIREVVALTAVTHSQRAYRVRKLAVLLKERFNATGMSQDLEESIRWHREALNLTSEDASQRADRLQRLAACLVARFERFRSAKDDEEAMQMSKEALLLTREKDSDNQFLLPSIEIIQASRSAYKGDTEDLTRSLERHLNAIACLPQGYRELAELHQSVAFIYVLRSQQTNSTKDLQAAIKHFEIILDLLPQDDLARPRILLIISFILEQKYNHTNAPEELHTAIRLAEAAISHPQASVDIQLRCGRMLVSSCAALQNWHQAYKYGSLAVSLVSKYIPSSLIGADRQHLVNEVIGMASNTASIAMRIDQPAFEIVQLLELGRGIIASSLGGLRVDASQLQQEHPHLAQAFQKVCTLLDDPVATSNVEERLIANQERDRLIDQIRRQPRFQRFLLGPDCSDLMQAAENGPKIIVNTSRYGCHAFLVEKHLIHAIELKHLHLTEIQMRAEQLPEVDEDMLAWLWLTVTEPVLRALHLLEIPKDSWPRVWWILTGALSRFPMHAAGEYTDRLVPRGVMDFAVSSYSSSIRALLEEKTRPANQQITHSVPKPVMVVSSMEHTPGRAWLEFVVKETSVVGDIGKKMEMQIKYPRSRREDVLQALAGCTIFHFAGHGLADFSDPSRSALILEDGGLTVQDLFDSKLGRPLLAFLSACGTGQVRDERLVDEGVHLNGAFQIAGFQHAIGSLWEVNDESSVRIAELTYQYLLEHDLSQYSVALGLHLAVRALRTDWLQQSSDQVQNEETPRRGETVEPNAFGFSEAILGQSVNTTRSWRALRHVKAVTELPLLWTPWIHSGI